MWSKQADVRNTNMTSLKSKITQRKRKNSKSSAPQPTVEAPVNTTVNTNQNQSGKSKSKNKKQNRKNKGRSESGSDAGSKEESVKDSLQPDLLGDLSDANDIKANVLNKNDVIHLPNGNARASFDNELIATDVVLRSGVQKSLSNSTESVNNTFKRYSDSFVVFGNGEAAEKPKPAELSRAQSTFLVTDTDSCEYIKSDKAERKHRRFSDLFRYGNLKSSNSCENLKAKMIAEFDVCQNGEFHGISLRQKTETAVPENVKDKKVCDKNERSNNKNPPNDDKSKFKKPLNKVDTNKPVKTKPKESTVVDNNSSYLKRVKSKIYKQRNESSNTLPRMPNIEENIKQKKKKKSEDVLNKLEVETRKSIPHFDFRLIRQTSNLERIRPKSFGMKKAESNVGISDLVDSTTNILYVPVEKPLLAKSKSSSAINLNLLRSRRNKQDTLKKNCTDVQDEFEFIAFGDIASSPGIRKYASQNFSSTAINNHNNNNWINDSGDAKPGHPASRTGSDRRPDAVKEESSRSQENHSSNDHEDDHSSADNTVSLPATTGHKKTTGNITRSESVKQQPEKRKQRRNISDPLHNTKREIDLNQDELSNTHSSASNSSLSSRSSDSPSTSIDAVPNISHHASSSVWDSDMEVEADPPDWHSSLTDEELSRLHRHEKKRQDVINELFHTERTHVRNLKVLEHVFLPRILASRVLKQDEINLIFSNVNELLDIHKEFNKIMKNKRKEEGPLIKTIGDMLINMFDGSQGESLQKAAATFCKRQHTALEFIKERRKKDSRFDSVLSDCEKNKECRRLPLQGIITTEMQRLTKYPLLLDRLIEAVHEINSKCNTDMPDELCKLKQVNDRAKEILSHVNEAAKLESIKERLEDIQRHTDMSYFERTDHPIVHEFRNLDLSRYKLLHEGDILLNRLGKSPLPVHLLILEEAVIILQKEGDKYLLKFLNTGSQSNSPPILKMSNVLVRVNAAEKDSFFILNSYLNVSVLYDLKAKDPADMQKWFKHLSDASESYGRREGKSKRCEPTPDVEETVQELPSTRDTAEHAETIGGNDTGIASGETDNTKDEPEVSSTISEVADDHKDKRLPHNGSDSRQTTKSPEIGGGGASVKLAADDWPLIQPSEMQVISPPVHVAESVLTPLEQIRRKDEEVRKALADKEVLVADLLSIPREDYHTIADMVGETAEGSEHEPCELVLAAIYQTNKLLQAVNDCLNISESDAVLVSGGKYPSCASNENLVSKRNNLPVVPVHTFKEVATTLNKQLSSLLSVVKQREEERDKIRKELQRTREQLHEHLQLHGPESTENVEVSALDCTQSGDLESIEESPTENENN